MGAGRSGNGGGRRDNRNWGGAEEKTGDRTKVDGYNVYDSKSEIESAMGLGTGGEADRWKKRLTPAEEYYAEAYTGNDHRMINEFERKGIVKGDTVEKLMHRNDILESALDKAVVEKPMLVNRSSSDDLLGGAHTVADIRKMFGQRVTDRGFMSSEISPTTSASRPYGSKHGEHQIFYHIKVPSGKGIGAYMRGVSPGAKQEQEFLFNRGATFKILGAYEDATGRTHVNLKWIGRFKRRAKIQAMMIDLYGNVGMWSSVNPRRTHIGRCVTRDTRHLYRPATKSRSNWISISDHGGG